MNIKEVAEKLNIAAYPDALNRITDFNTIPDISDLQWLSNTENTYHVLGKYYPLVRQAVQELQTDKLKYHWGMTVAKYLVTCTVTEARSIPLPPRDGTLSGDFLPLLILLTALPAGVEEFRHRDMPKDMIRRNLDHIVDGISIVEFRTGRPGINQTYFNWLVKFIKATLFNCYGFNFEIRELPENLFVLQNIADGSLIPFLHNVTIHRSGKLLNSAGCEKTEGSYSVQFKEDKNNYIGYPCINGNVSSRSKKFSKNKYHLILQSGDTVLSVHIPRGTDISRQKTAESLTAAFKDASIYYPEYNIKALYCHSWLLDPILADLTKPGSRIPQFGSIFSRYPAKSFGKEVFDFVFPRIMPLEELPEKTSLERSVKQHYINGNFVLAYSGIVLPEQL